MKNYYTIIAESPMDTFIYVYDNLDLFQYSISKKVDYTPEMVQEAFENEERQRLSHANPYPREPYTYEGILKDFQEHKIYPNELSRVIGAKRMFFDFKEYTQWLMDNKNTVNIVETFEGIQP